MIEKKLTGAIVEVMGCEASEITANANLVDDLGADSLDVIEILMACEEAFDVEISDDAAEKCKTVGELQALVTKLNSH